MTEGLKCGGGGWGDTEAAWFEGAEMGSGDRWEETKKFRIHNVTVKFSGEICTGPQALANKICHHLSVRETALNRFLHITLPPHTGLMRYSMWSRRKRGNTKYGCVLLAKDHLEKVKKKKNGEIYFPHFFIMFFSNRVTFPAQFMFVSVCVCVFKHVYLHENTASRQQLPPTTSYW